MNLWKIMEGLAIGFILGALYFYFLWQTVRRIPSDKHPFRLMVVSFLARASLAVTVFYFTVKDGDYICLFCALAGFLIAREIGKRIWGLGKSQPLPIPN